VIGRMAKVAVAGPLELARETLATVQELGVLHVAQEVRPKPAGNAVIPGFRPLPDEEKILAERIALEELRAKVVRLLQVIPQGESRKPSLRGEAVARIVSQVVDDHLARWEGFSQDLERLRRQVEELGCRQQLLQEVIQRFPRWKRGEDPGSLLVVSGPEGVSRAKEALGEEILKERRVVECGSLLGVVVERLEPGDADDSSVEAERLPLEEQALTMEWERCARIRGDLVKRIAQIEETRATFVKRWRGVYLVAAQWLDSQLALIAASAKVYKTGMCFVLFGWIPAADLPRLEQTLEQRFEGKVAVEELAILEEEVDQVPVVLMNPPFFKPFEVFTRLLPPPSYSSFDITPFLGIFFPIFFGIMLGDVGYGLIITATAAAMVLLLKNKPLIVDVAKVFGVCGVYTILFGIVFGELFGSFGQRFLPLPHFIDRKEAVVPMLLFALAAGVVHVVLGLVLGMISAMRRGTRREALFKLGTIGFVLLAVLIAVAMSRETLAGFVKPLAAAAAILACAMILIGGVMAPLEMLKTVGNIVSYARIMAIGLTSVLLAYVANQMAGSMGSLLLGVVVGVVLHGFNILLGIFAPAVHGLRLHYVEFLSKFMEPGSGRFSPLAKHEGDVTPQDQETGG